MKYYHTFIIVESYCDKIIYHVLILHVAQVTVNKLHLIKFVIKGYFSTYDVFYTLKWNSCQKATKALFVIEYESNLRVKA